MNIVIICLIHMPRDNEKELMYLFGAKLKRRKNNYSTIRMIINIFIHNNKLCFVFILKGVRHSQKFNIKNADTLKQWILVINGVSHPEITGLLSGLILF